EDRPVVRAGYDVAAVGAILSGLLLTVDLGQPLRFWHMLFQSEHFPAIMFKAWSPISFGAWAILLFGLFSVLSALGAKAEEGRLRNAALRAVGGVVRGGLAKLVSGVGGILGFFIAGYTGVLLSVTNRPIWADSPWLGALFLVSGASTGAAMLILLAPGRGAAHGLPGGLCQSRGLARARGRARRRPGQPQRRHRIAPGREDVLSDALPHREGEMLWPHARLRRPRNVALQTLVADARRERPESEAWLGLLESALGESEAGAVWEAAVPQPAVDRPVKAPLLFRATLMLDPRAAREGVHR